MPRSPFTELVSWVHPFTQRRPNETLELLTLTTSTPPSPGSPPESSPNEKYNVYQELDRATELQVSMLISMPDPHQPRYTRIGSSLSVKGKERSLDRDGYSEDWDDLEGVPDVVFGITRVPFRSCASD